MLWLVLLAAAAIESAAWLIVAELRAARRAATVGSVVATFGSASVAVQRDPKELLIWHPLATAARKLFPDVFRELDATTGGVFPFTREQLQAAHARWTTDWLSWERAHDLEYKVRAAAAEQDLARDRESEAARGRLQAIEREKLERYQQRYEEYVRVSKALAALDEAAPTR